VPIALRCRADTCERPGNIAIAQGSSELTISIVVRRNGLERAIQSVHRECR
jgi:aspartate kinase